MSFPKRGARSHGELWRAQSSSLFFLSSVGYEPLWQEQCGISLSLSEKLDMQKQQCGTSPSCKVGKLEL